MTARVETLEARLVLLEQALIRWSNTVANAEHTSWTSDDVQSVLDELAEIVTVDSAPVALFEEVTA